MTTITQRQADRVRLIIFDTNIWLDYYLGFRAGNAAATRLLTLANNSSCELLYAVTSSKDLFYLIAADFKRAARQNNDGALSEGDSAAASEVAWACLSHMGEIATAVACDESDVWAARKQRPLHADYEDNLVVAAAMRVKADLLVTNDELLLRHSPVATLPCEDAITYLGGDSPACR